MVWKITFTTLGDLPFITHVRNGSYANEYSIQSVFMDLDKSHTCINPCHVKYFNV